AGFKIYIVGGAVRDLILGKEVKDWDFTTDAKPEEILEIFPGGFYDNKFGTVGIPMGTQIMEITTMRKEGLYKDHRHPIEVGWTNNIEEDLARRDFTINAIAAAGTNQLDFIDPFTGQKDVRDQLIKAVGEPNKRLEEDALRLMRAVRFASQLKFTIEKKT